MTDLTDNQGLDADYLSKWIGEGETVEDVISAGPAQRMAATLDIKDMDLSEGADLPPFWHWAYTLTAAPASDLRRDGHPAVGDYLPPVALPRRMWAGGRLEPGTPLRIGEATRRESRVTDVTMKNGRSGTLCFIVVRHEFYVGDELRVAEEHDIVCREDADPSAPVPPAPTASTDADWSEAREVDPVTLFRYSALTFNSHRIHYDRSYCRDVEGYDGLVIHGPLSTTLLLDLLRRKLPDAHVKNVAFRAISPLFDTAPITLAGKQNGDQVDLWAATAEGHLAMQATAELG
jgi:3-methylfumaryl-CoA hydratase